MHASQLPLSHEATALAVSADGKRLAASAIGNGRTVVYDLRVGRALFRFGVGATGLALSPDGARLVTAWSDDTRAPPSAARFAVDARVEADEAAYTVRVFELVSGKCLTPEPWRGEAPIALSPDGKLLAVTADRLTSAVLVYDLAGEALVHVLVYPHRRRLRSLAWSPDGRLLTAATGATPVVHWSTDDFQEVRPKGVREHDAAVAFSPDGELVAAAGPDSRIRLFERDREGEPRAVLSVMNGQKLLRGVAALDFSPDGELVVALGRTRATQLFSVSLARPLWTASPGPMAFLPDGKTLAAWWCGAVWLRDAESGDLRVSTADDTSDEGPVGGPVSRTVTLRSRELEGPIPPPPQTIRVVGASHAVAEAEAQAASAALLARLSTGWAESSYRTAAHLLARDADGLGVRLPLLGGYTYVQIRPRGERFRILVTVTADEPDHDPPPSSSLVRLSRWIRDRLSAEARRVAAADREWAAEIAPGAGEGDVHVERGQGSLTITLDLASLLSLDDLEALIHAVKHKLEP
ncbi:WD40 repeat domain-containing protein [Polyangium spumosum]|uniref:Anaphase-promoting complex subunit 4 WD40 domain-containing protein n=1 Tax=Polyangium spumosum TaxID=889282 RepID=A0A6N7PJU7_9BACT|nr:hypothetical protein [Polyangium spumosum]MRG90425.1 hypothetical protein [Polyangium spumosum]